MTKCRDERVKSILQAAIWIHYARCQYSQYREKTALNLPVSPVALRLFLNTSSIDREIWSR